MKPAELLRMRLRSLLVDGSTAKTPHDVVAHLMAVQAQDYPGALWALGLRQLGATLASVEAAIAESSILRTWPMRGTLHFVTAEDVHWLLPLLTPRVVARAAKRERDLQIDDAVLGLARETLVGALTGGRRLARPDAMAALEAAGIACANQRGYHILWRLAQEGTLAAGPAQGKQQTFLLLAEWVPRERSAFPPDTPRAELLAHIARRFITGHGPATVEDLARWIGVTKAEAGAALDAVADDFETAECDGVRYSFAPSVAEAASRRSPLHLLPAFDEYLLGYASRDHQLGRHAEEFGASVASNGMFAPTVIADGRVVGQWRRNLTGRSVRFGVTEFEPLSATAHKALAPEQRRYARFMGREVARG